MANSAELDIILRVIDNASDEFKKVNAEAIRTVNELKTAQVSSGKASADAVNKVIEKTKELSSVNQDFYGDFSRSLGSTEVALDNVKNGFQELKASNDIAYSNMAVAYRDLEDKTKKVKEETKSFGSQLKQLSKDARQLRQSLFVVTAALAVMIKGINDAAEYDKQAKATVDGLNASLKSLSATIGIIFEPAIQGLTVVIDGFRMVIEAAFAGFIKLFSFVFEFLAQLPSAFKNVFDNIKAVFTGEDPIGIVEGFRLSFQRAVDVANIATDQILNRIETTRAKIGTGRTIDNEEKKRQDDIQRTKEAEEKRAITVRDLKTQAYADTKEMLSKMAEENKAFAVINQGIAIVESIINTATAVTKALPNLPLAAVVGAIGAAKTALIASQKFHTGGMVKGNLASDEVPIIAQTGEGILSRRGMSALGGEGNLNRLNDGQGVSGSGQPITVNVWYPKMSKKEEAEELASALGFNLQKELRYAR